MGNLDRHTRSALRKELQHAEEERARLDVVVAYLRERLREYDQDSSEKQESPGRAGQSTAQSKNGARLTAADAAALVLSDRGKPMRTPEILIEVQTRGAKMKNVDGLFRTLKNSERFKRIGRGLWALSDWPEESESGLGE